MNYKVIIFDIIAAIVFSIMLFNFNSYHTDLSKVHVGNSK